MTECQSFCRADRNGPLRKKLAYSEVHEIFEFCNFFFRPTKFFSTNPRKQMRLEIFVLQKKIDRKKCRSKKKVDRKKFWSKIFSIGRKKSVQKKVDRKKFDRPKNFDRPKKKVDRKKSPAHTFLGFYNGT